MRKSRSIVTVFTVGFLLLAIAAQGRGETAVKYHPTDHFLLGCPMRDYEQGKITDENLAKWESWLETPYKRFAGLGFLPPATPKVKFKGKDLIKVVIVDFGQTRLGEEHSTARGAATPAGVIALNLNMFGDTGQDTHNKCTAAHELFHMIQHAYNPKEDRWLDEATARWAPGAIYPEIDQAEHCVPDEAIFLKYANLPLPFLYARSVGKDRDDLMRKIGHPYGASILFRFLARQPGGNDTIKRVWEESGKGPPGPRSLQALPRALGAASMMDPKFRAIYDRFAVGCALNDVAPADCQLEDAAKLKIGETKGRLPPTDLSAGWLDYCQRWTASPSEPPFTPAFVSPPDLAVVMATGQVTGPAAGGGLKGWVGGSGGMRCFALARPTGIPKGTGLEVVKPSDQDDVSVQGLARYPPSSAVQVYKAAYDAAKKSYTLLIPQLDQAGPRVLVLVTRYSDTLDARNYPLSFALKPPSGVTYYIYKGKIGPSPDPGRDSHRFGDSIVLLAFAVTGDKAEFGKANIVMSKTRIGSDTIRVGETYGAPADARGYNWYNFSNRTAVKAEYASPPKQGDTSVGGTLQIVGLSPPGPKFQFQAALVKQLTPEEFDELGDPGPGYKAILDAAYEEIGDRSPKSPPRQETPKGKPVVPR